MDRPGLYAVNAASTLIIVTAIDAPVVRWLLAGLTWLALMLMQANKRIAIQTITQYSSGILSARPFWRYRPMTTTIARPAPLSNTAFLMLLRPLMFSNHVRGAVGVELFLSVTNFLVFQSLSFFGITTILVFMYLAVLAAGLMGRLGTWRSLPRATREDLEAQLPSLADALQTPLVHLQALIPIMEQLKANPEAYPDRLWMVLLGKIYYWTNTIVLGGASLMVVLGASLMALTGQWREALGFGGLGVAGLWLISHDMNWSLPRFQLPQLKLPTVRWPSVQWPGWTRYGAVIFSLAVNLRNWTSLILFVFMLPIALMPTVEGRIWMILIPGLIILFLLDGGLAKVKQAYDQGITKAGEQAVANFLAVVATEKRSRSLDQDPHRSESE